MNETRFKMIVKKGLIILVKKYENGNMGHRPGLKEDIVVPPVDSAQDMRGEYLKDLRDVGITVEKHH